MDNLSQEVGLIAIVSLFLLLVAVGIVTLVFAYRRKQTEYIHEQTRMKAAFEKELLGAQLEIQEQTMKHIAQEIHDNIGQTLSLAKLNLNTINLAKQSGTVEKIDNTKELVSKAIIDLRTLSKTLHAEAVMSVGLVKAIELELKLVDKAAVFQTSFIVSGTPVAIDPQKELILFRTIQEALNNSIKHSEASSIEVILHYADALELTIQDNGKGFNLQEEENNPEKGSGLRNMHNRTKMIGGSFFIDGTKGTKVHITLPTIQHESNDSPGR